MIVNNLKVKNKNINKNVDIVIYISKDVNNSNLNDTTMLQNNNCLIIIILTFFSFKISKNDNEVTLKEKRQLHPFVQGDSIVSLPDKQSCNLNESDWVDGRDSN